MPRHLVRLFVHLAAVGVRLNGDEVEKAPLAAGEVGDQVGGREGKRLAHQAADVRRREELPVFDPLFCLAVLVVVCIVPALQPVQAAVARVGVEQVLGADAEVRLLAALDQVQYLLVERAALDGIDGRGEIAIFHVFDPSFFTR